MSNPILPAGAPLGRDPRLDVFRGICLVMIFINHVPGNMFEDYTSRNFGFSDAAEGFVMMSGIAAGLAYSNDFKSVARFWTGFARVWKRAWTLYQAHIVCTLAALAAASAVTLITHNAEILFDNAMRLVWVDPLRTFVGLSLLTHQFGYVNILPMYLVLLFASPIIFILAFRAPLWSVMAGSVVLWFFAGLFRWNLPNFPTEGGWFFNPLTWQVIFTAGMLTGISLKNGARFIPITRGLQWTTGLFLLFSLLTFFIPPLQKGMGKTLWFINQMGTPWNLTAFDKSYTTAPRLLHILALTYFISSFPAVRRIVTHKAFFPFELLGRQALPVFATGSVLCIAFQGIKKTTGQDPLYDSLLIGGGLLIQLALAASRQYWPKPPKA